MRPARPPERSPPAPNRAAHRPACHGRGVAAAGPHDAAELAAAPPARACKPVGIRSAPVASGLTGRRGPVPKLVWRVKLAAELEPGVATETEVARFERGEEAGPAELGLRLEEAKRLTAAIQAQIVPAQVTTIGERRRWCAACGQRLASKGHYRARFRSLFGDVPVQVRRLLVCPCHGPGEPKSFAALDLGGGC